MQMTSSLDIKMQMSPIEILVVDDDPRNIESANRGFSGPEFSLTTADNYMEAGDLIRPDFKWNHDKDSATNLKRLDEQGISRFDVVLTDLVLPYGKPTFEYRPVKQGFGFPIALLAAKYRVPSIAVVTYGNHHKEEIIFGIEDLSGGGRPNFEECVKRGFMKINNSRVLFATAPVYEPGKDRVEDWTKAVKDWKKVYDALAGYTPKK